MKALWDGNMAIGAPDLLTDACVALVGREVPPGRFRERLMKPHAHGRRVAPARIRKIWRGIVSRPTKALRLTDVTAEHQNGAPIVSLNAARGKTRTVWVDARRLETVRRAVRFDRITQARHGTPLSCLVFWRGKRPVAMLMPMRVPGFPEPVANEPREDQK